MVNSLFTDKQCAVLFEYFGVTVFAYLALKYAVKIWNNLSTFFLGLGNVNLKKYGSWACVTGCTDGIGKSYAEQLAKRGLNIVLISRSMDKLQELAKTLESKYSVKTKCVAADFTESTSIYADIKKQISSLDIGVLVNNVGMSYKHPEFFADFVANESEKKLDDLINCNITSVNKMTAIVLPGMIERKAGIIINNSSASGRVPTPLLTVYSATKAYVDFFSRALNIEYQSKGIKVQSLCPYFVSTKLSAVRPSIAAPKPDTYVKSALGTIGSQEVTNGCLIHNIQGWFFESIMPRSILNKASLSALMGARKKGLAKQKRLAEEQKSK